jgi:hypothetical protein
MIVGESFAGGIYLQEVETDEVSGRMARRRQYEQDVW